METEEHWLCTYVIILGIVIYCPLQDNNVKWPNSVLSGEHELWQLNFLKFLFQIYYCVPDLVWESFDSDKQSEWRVRVSQDSWVNYKFVFYYCPRVPGTLLSSIENNRFPWIIDSSHPLTLLGKSPPTQLPSPNPFLIINPWSGVWSGNTD